MNMTLFDFIILIFTCWNENYQPPTIDMTKYKRIERYTSGFYSMFVLDTNPF